MKKLSLLLFGLLFFTGIFTTSAQTLLPANTTFKYWYPATSHDSPLVYTFSGTFGGGYDSLYNAFSLRKLFLQKADGYTASQIDSIAVTKVNTISGAVIGGDFNTLRPSGFYDIGNDGDSTSFPLANAPLNGKTSNYSVIDINSDGATFPARSQIAISTTGPNKNRLLYRAGGSAFSAWVEAAAVSDVTANSKKTDSLYAAIYSESHIYTVPQTFTNGLISNGLVNVGGAVNALEYNLPFTGGGDNAYSLTPDPSLFSAGKYLAKVVDSTFEFYRRGYVKSGGGTIPDQTIKLPYGKSGTIALTSDISTDTSRSDSLYAKKSTTLEKNSLVFINSLNQISGDSTKFYANLTYPALGIGIKPQPGFNFEIGFNGLANARIASFSDVTTNAGGFNLFHAGGTEASPTQSLANFRLGTLSFGGLLDNGSYSNMGRIIGTTVEAMTSSAQGGNIQIQTTLAGTSTQVTSATFYAKNTGFGGNTAPTAYIHPAAGTASAGTAPFKFTAGTNLTTTEAGAIEYNGSHLFFTAANGGSRYQLDATDVAEQSYTLTPTWDGTAPTTLTGVYRWSRVGSLVTLQLTLNYGAAGATNTMVDIPLPTDCPNPILPSNVISANNRVICMGSGRIALSQSSGTVSDTNTALRVNSTNTGYDVRISSTSISAICAYATVSYYAN